MSYRSLAGCTCALLVCSAATLSIHPTQQTITPSPDGPYHVAGNLVVDSHGRPFLMRGTQLTEFHPQTMAHDNRSGRDFGEHSATSLSAIRLRFNMNTVRLPLDVTESGQPGYFAKLARVVRRANDIDLMVVLAAREPGAGMPTHKTVEFWSHCAAAFRSYRNVIFEAYSDPVAPAGVDAHSAEGWSLWRKAMTEVVQAIRAAGAEQPIAVTGWKDDRLFEGASLLDDGNLIYEAAPSFASMRTDADRDARFGFLAARAPVFVSGMDFDLTDAAACSTIPNDPSAASAMLEAVMNYFDRNQISWTASVYQPGRLVKDLSLQDATSLENGWSCGPQTYPAPGIGRVVEGHLRSNEERGLFVVSAGGGPDVARGGFAIGYGPVMADHDSHAVGNRPALKLGKLSVQITDSQGTTRPAPIFYATAGWGQINFVIPQTLATGPARMTVVREDGSRETSPITIADTAPGFWTGVSCRGPAQGTATQVFADGRKVQTNIQACDPGNCWSLPIPVAAGASTQVRMKASGFRYAGSAANIVVTAAGVRLPVVSFGATDEPGVDQVTIEIPTSLRGKGVVDLICHVNHRVSNAVQIRIGGETPAS